MTRLITTLRDVERERDRYKAALQRADAMFNARLIEAALVIREALADQEGRTE